MIPYEWRQFDNFGFVAAKLTDELLKPIKDEIQEIQNNFHAAEKFNDGLAGNIEHEYALTKSHRYIEELVLPYVKIYDDKFNLLKSINLLNREVPLGMYDKPWVNFMKKHEFNPNHIHTGVISFVLWIDIPYDIEEEKAQNYCKDSKLSVPGHFEFLHTNALGEIQAYHIPADKTYNNTLLVFPSKLRHGVYPFATSDEYRVSVSGNYKFIV